jgi:stage II sporulation protein M
MIKDFINYLYSIKRLIIICFLVFAFSVLGGYISVQNSPGEAEEVFEQLKQMYGSVHELDSFGQFIFIILNNSIALFFSILLGLVFGIIPFIFLFSNGAILGILMYLFGENFSLSQFFLGILPHGILEIPVLIIGCAMGLRVGKEVIDKVFRKKGDITKELSRAIEFFWKIIIPLLILAAAIEVFITAKILGV